MTNSWIQELSLAGAIQYLVDKNLEQAKVTREGVWQGAAAIHPLDKVEDDWSHGAVGQPHLHAGTPIRPVYSMSSEKEKEKEKDEDSPIHQ